jgi:hypothetical protein
MHTYVPLINNLCSKIMSQGLMVSMKDLYNLEKWIWSDKDFEQMVWHDCPIYSLAFFSEDYEFALDIDYIFKWIHPPKGKKHFKFWIAPVTVVFENSYDIIFDIETNKRLNIDNITKGNPQKPKNSKFVKKDSEWDWKIECQEGSINIKSVGFKMYVKSNPILTINQNLGISERGGVNFNRYKT